MCICSALFLFVAYERVGSVFHQKHLDIRCSKFPLCAVLMISVCVTRKLRGHVTWETADKRQFSGSHMLSPTWHHELKLPCRTVHRLLRIPFRIHLLWLLRWTDYVNSTQYCISGGVTCCTLRFSALSFCLSCWSWVTYILCLLCHWWVIEEKKYVLTELWTQMVNGLLLYLLNSCI
jgi:hypothetical protein